jgi:phosphatidylserine decarboxylase
VVLIGALFVGSIETVHAGEINPPASRGGSPRRVATGEGREFRKGEELGRFNMGSTVVMIWQKTAGEFAPGLAPGSRLRLGQLLAGTSAQR